MLTFPPADPHAAPFAPPMEEATAWDLVALTLADEGDAGELFDDIACRAPAFLAWSIVRCSARAGNLAESIEVSRGEALANGFARFLLPDETPATERQAFAGVAGAFDATRFRRALDQVLPEALRLERIARDAQRAFDAAAALAPAYALLGRVVDAEANDEARVPWETLPLPAGWKRLWRRAALRYGIDERALERASVEAAKEAWTVGRQPATALRADSSRDDAAPRAHRTLQRAAELALDRSASEEEFACRLDAERWASMKELAYGASHEINNPLANIASRAQTLALDEKDADRLAKLRTIERQAFRAFTMIQNLTLVAEPPAPQLSRFDWSEGLDRWLAKWQEEAAAKGIRIERAGAREAAGIVDADEAQSELVFDELIRNALEASPSGARIVVEGPSTAPENVRSGAGTSLMATISDEGSGLSPVARQRLFDPFFSGREAGRGQGFGLSKARRIVENHGGSLRCRERVPRGLAVEWRMPRARRID